MQSESAILENKTIPTNQDSIEWIETPETSIGDPSDRETSDVTTPERYSSRKHSESHSCLFKSNVHSKKRGEDVKTFDRLEEALDDLYDRLSEKLRSFSYGALSQIDDSSVTVTDDLTESPRRVLPVPGSVAITHPYTDQYEEESESSSNRLFAWLGREDFEDYFPRLNFDSLVPENGYE